MALYEILEDGTIVPKTGKTVGNLDCLRTEVVYDMSSSDANKNWGYTSGIQGSSSAITKDLTKYKMLLIYYQSYFSDSLNTGGNANCLILDLERKTDNYSIAGNEISYFYHSSPNNTARFSFQARYNHSSKTLNFLFGYQANAELNNGQYFVYKIEGILKEPAMIYTGDELNAGDGIVINNGTLSSNVTRKTLFQGTVSSASEFSLNDTLANYKFILLTAFDNFNNYVTTMIDASTLRVHSTRSAPIGISSSSSTVDRYAEVYYVNETKLGILTPKNMSLRFVEGIK